jgi:hypothetical protein
MMGGVPVHNEVSRCVWCESQVQISRALVYELVGV